MNETVPHQRIELPSSKRLLVSTLVAILVAALLLVTLVLPFEYGVDPTRLGRLLGLTQVGRDKMTQAVWEKKVGTAVPRSDEMTVVLKPGEGVELKLEISKGSKAHYEWTATGGGVYHNTHGEGIGGNRHSYGKAEGVERDAGELIAPFDGDHGWFWRNRTNGEVSITLKTSGEYWKMKRVI